MQKSAIQSAPTSPSLSVVETLVDYFNDTILSTGHWSEDNVFSARSASLQLIGGQVAANVGPLQLNSDMRCLLDPADKSARTGRLASLQVVTRTGRSVAADIPLRLQASTEAVRTMDRLCRLLHMLNHLALGREDEDLWLHVSLGHILSVPADHGQHFEELLKRCGLGADQIGLLVPPLPITHPDFQALAQSISNYQQRGYTVAIDLPRDWPMTAWQGFQLLGASWVRLRGEQMLQALALEKPRAWILRDAADLAVPFLKEAGARVILEKRTDGTPPQPH